MPPTDLARELWQERAVAIVRAATREAARGAMEAAVRGGFRVVEFTANTPGALELVGEFARRPELVVGTGTVLTPALARDAAGAGARFVVSPVVDEEVIAEALRLGLDVVPGAHTPTEMLRAHRAGAKVVKLFPSPGAGPEYVRACLGPLPFLRLVPTHGVGDDAARWLEAGAWAVGFTASLFDPGDLHAGRFDRIEERARRLLALARGVSRGEP